MGAVPTRLRCPTSKRASLTFNLISCEAKEVVYHRFPVFEYRSTMVHYFLRFTAYKVESGGSSLRCGTSEPPRYYAHGLAEDRQHEPLGTAPMALPRTGKNSPHNLFHQYQIVGRTLPTESDEHPKIYHMKLWATNEVRAKSKFWVFSVEAEEGQEEQWAKACY
ncbi:hypothetical protein SO802_013337 [Lithocarpus litseifolius]|uniref:Ribosomal protein 50S-L18Ae/60S-L20/60S-L18A domain-containing protein n=1 Tax=Lithocarpus litseifolius TaxID=425828 RepID=A0AAW2D9E9_9ROSI